MNTATATHTHQTLSLETREGKSLLRRIMKDPGEWSGSCSAGTSWQLQFRRTIKGAPGEPDKEVTVSTDYKIEPRRITHDLRDYDGGEVIELRIPDARRLWLRHSDLATLIHFILDGWTIDAHTSRGSLNASREGIAFWILTAEKPGAPYVSVTISATTYKDGRLLTSGAIE